MHGFIAEMMAICRAHVATLGGNALVSFQLNECVLDDNLHKNQVCNCLDIHAPVIFLYIIKIYFIKCNLNRLKPSFCSESIGPITYPHITHLFTKPYNKKAQSSLPKPWLKYALFL